MTGPARVEIEVKVLDVDVDSVRRRLAAIGAAPAGSGRLVTAVYDFPDRRLLSTGAHARVRRDGSGRAEVCYKGSGAGDARYKVKEEIEFGTSDFEAACSFLERLGLERVSVLEKDRSTFQRGEIVFCLDTWPVIPTYLEVEASTPEQVEEGLALLGIDPSRANTMGPLELFRHYGLDLEKMREVLF